MYDEETKQIVAHLAQAVRDSGHSQRWVETAMEVSHGYLSLLFNGKLELKVRHVFMICGALGLDPFEFLIEVLREVQKSRRRLTPLEASKRRAQARRAELGGDPQQSIAATSSGMTREAVQALLWHELAKVGIFPDGERERDPKSREPDPAE